MLPETEHGETEGGTAVPSGPCFLNASPQGVIHEDWEAACCKHDGPTLMMGIE